MSDHSATVMLVGEGADRHVVVTQADDVIWIAPELISERHTGDLEIDGATVSFGTPGEGLGRLTYRITGERTDDFGHHWTVAEREASQCPE